VLLERYARQAVLLEKPRHLADARELAGLLAPDWPAQHVGLMDSGVPVADRQGFRTMQQFPDPPVAAQAQVAAAALTALWLPATTAPNMAIAANTIRPGQIFKVTAWGVTTTAVTGSQTLVVTPVFGSVVSGGTSVALGASRTAAVQAAVNTNVPWFLEMWVHFKAIGLVAIGLATCGGRFDSYTAVGTAATTNASTITFGTSAASAAATAVDTTVASGLIVGVTASLSTQTFQTASVFMETIN
jgi:hypothetical protein